MTIPPLVYTIRHMVPEDLLEVHALDQMSFPSPWSLKGYRHELLENPNARLWVADLPKSENMVSSVPSGEIRLVGVLVAWFILDEIHIGTIAVHPAFRRMGIGERLLCTAFEELIAQGAVCANLEVRESNTAAQKLYQRFGFYEVNRRRGYYQDNGEDAILMNLDDLPRALAAVR